MRVERIDRQAAKGWLLGPWNAPLQAAVGFATEAIDEPHLHHRTTEIYLVVGGSSEARVERTTIRLEAGDVLVVEPGEAHTFLACTSDYLQFVVQLPGLPAEEARTDKTSVSRRRLGLAD